jgi:hypothetical protein
MDSTVMYTGIIVFLIVLVGLFLLLREVNCWYWKINERVVLMKQNNELLKKISFQLQGETGNEIITVEEKKTGKRKTMTREEYVVFLSKVNDRSGYVIVNEEE